VLIDPPTFRRLVRARELLATDDREIRAIAASVTLSPFHFIRTFAGLFGDTPHQFRTRLRVERAKALLAKGTTVTDACLEIGFSSIGSFSAMFTRWTGSPPSVYRRSVAVPRSFSPAWIPGCLGMIAQVPAWRSA
jgi:AraC-like DNA-binding protein